MTSNLHTDDVSSVVLLWVGFGDSLNLLGDVALVCDLNVRCGRATIVLDSGECFSSIQVFAVFEFDARCRMVVSLVWNVFINIWADFE